MIVLGIDTSCDDTCASVIDGEQRILSNVVSSQEVHALYGGVVPELASRAHIRLIAPIVSEALTRADIDLGQVEGIAVTRGPGLIGSLLVGLSYAKALAYVADIPFVAIHHIEGHILSNFVEHPELRCPYLNLVVSGGHTDLIYVRDRGDYQTIGSTADDAAGEALDKIAKLLGLPYPGGPQIEAQSMEGNRLAFSFPISKIERYDFSFSGLKTAALYTWEEMDPDRRISSTADVAASFQEAVVDALVEKTIRAATDLNCSRVAVSGGVAANVRLREKFTTLAGEQGLETIFPSPVLCTDNAVMVAAAGHFRLARGERSPFDLEAMAQLPLDSATSDQ